MLKGLLHDQTGHPVHSLVQEARLVCLEGHRGLYLWVLGSHVFSRAS